MFAIGLHREGSQYQVALLRREKGKVSLESLHQLSEENVKQLYTLTQNPFKLATALSTNQVLVRELSLKLKQKRSVYKVLPFQAEALFPYPKEELILLPFLYPKGKKGIEITLMGTSKNELKKHQESLGLESDWVSSVPKALYRWALHHFPEEKALFVCYVGEESSTCIFIQDRRLRFSQLIPKNSSLEKEIERHFAFLKIKYGIEEAPPVVFAGKLGSIPHSESAISIGLALDALSQDENASQFLITPSKKDKGQRVRSLNFYVAACFLLALLAGVGSHLFLKKKQEVLYDKMRSHWHLNLNSASNLETEIDKLQTSLFSEKKLSSYLLTVPKVSDFLAWLSTHPLLIQKNSIDISRLHYSLVKYPTTESPTESYSVKVDLEFFCVNPTTAREFHDLLLSGAGFVNTHQKVSWNASQNHYHTSFFLKS